MEQAWMSTRSGYLEQLVLRNYYFSSSVSRNLEKMTKLKEWLKKRSGYPIYAIKNDFFMVPEDAQIPENFQYQFRDLTILQPPYKNTQELSGFLAASLCRNLETRYKRFLSDHSFVVDKLHLPPFQLLKVVSFNVEFFPSGHYMIHFQLGTKIVGQKFPVTKEFVHMLKANNKNCNDTDRMEFFLVHILGKYRKNLDLMDPALTAVLEDVIEESSTLLATFNPHFLTNYDNELYRKVLKFTHTAVRDVHTLLQPVLSSIELAAFWGLSEAPLMTVEIHKPINANNLLVGAASENITIHDKKPTQYGLRVAYSRDDVDPEQEYINFISEPEKLAQFEGLAIPAQLSAKISDNPAWKQPYISKLMRGPADNYSKVSVQSASFYNGVYRPADSINFLPLMCDGLKPDILLELIATFNRGATNCKVLPPIHVPENVDIDIKEIRAVLRDVSGPILVMACYRYQKTNHFFHPLRQLRHQIYQGVLSEDQSSRQKLSNFVCKCLEKAGASVCAIADTHIGEDGYFLGIDLGHSGYGREAFSNLALVLFDHRGILCGHSMVRNKIRKENLEPELCKAAFLKLRGILELKMLPPPRHLVIHRDGKLHANDISILRDVVGEIWGALKLDIVEIIKSGFPVIAKYNTRGESENLSSGSAYRDDVARYAILVTNTQADQEKAILNPIIIKHKYGEMAFSKIVDQVYWFTKVYTNNLYYSTRLPATTLKANNIVSTSNKVHQSSYLG